jgi:hypothetical protein
MKAIATLAVVFGLVTYCGAQNTIEYADIQNAPSVSGTLMVHMPANLTPSPERLAPQYIGGAKVCEMSNDWKAELQCTTTDSQGHWSFPLSPQSRTYRIKFIKAGFSQLRIRLRVEHGAKPLTVEMSVAT